MMIRNFLEALKIAALARSYIRVVAIVFVCITIVTIAILFSPIHEYAKYALIAVLIILSILLWFRFSSRLSKIPPIASEESLIHLLQYGVTYGSNGNLIRVEDVEKLESRKNPKLLPAPSEPSKEPVEKDTDNK